MIGKRRWDSAVITDVKVQLYADTAIVTGLWTWHGTMDGKPMGAANRWTDTWVKLNGTWKCVAAQLRGASARAASASTCVSRAIAASV